MTLETAGCWAILMISGAFSVGIVLRHIRPRGAGEVVVDGLLQLAIPWIRSQIVAAGIRSATADKRKDVK